MKTCKLILLGVCLGLALASGANAACTYFVDNSSAGCSGSGCSDSNNGTSLATAWRTLHQLASQHLTAGQTACLVGQSNPNTTNGGIWREQYVVNGQGTGWGAAKQVTITSYDPTKPAIVTGSKCYGAAGGLCAGSPPVTWHHCASGDALCNNSTNPNVTNVWEYTRPTLVQGAIYVDDPDVIYQQVFNGTTLWADQTHYLLWASGLPGAGSTRATDHNIADMTAGSFYDDGTHLYAWMADNSNPGNHTLEATTCCYDDGLIKNSSSTGQNKYAYFSYLELLYFENAGIFTTATNSGNTIPVWYDHNIIGGFGAGPTVNESGNFYDAAVSSWVAAGAAPTGALTATDVHVTNNVVNWCGSHNCINTQGSSGLVIYSGNVVGTSNHNQLDIKCPYHALVQNNYVHDAWRGVPIGNTGYAGNQGALYTETDWSACTGGPGIVWQNNTLYKVNYGAICHLTQTGGVAVTQVCKAYNNTMYLNAGEQSSSAAGIWFDNEITGATLNGDFQNNIVYHPDATGHGYLWTRGSGANTNNVTEAYNLYYGGNGSNKNTYLGAASTTLANWQANCGGSGACGTFDLWQQNPYFSGMTSAPLPTLRLFSYSPAINAGSASVGTSTTMGAAAEIVGGH